MNPADIKLTRLESVTRSVKRTYVTLREVYEEIRTNPSCHAFSWAMKMNNDGQRHQYEKFRKTIPAYIFSGEHRLFGTTTHNGLICLDFDRCDMSLKDDIAKAPFVAMVFTSPSGKGLKVVVAIEGTYDFKSKGQWEEVFSQVSKVFKDTFGLTADRQASDFGRRCFSAHDPDARIATDCHAMWVGVHLNVTDYHCISLCHTKEGVYRTTVSNAVEMTYAKKEGERNEKLGYFARAVKFNCGIKAENTQEIEAAFRLWYNRSCQNVVTTDYDTNRLEFVAWYRTVQKPLGPPKNSIADAWTMVEFGEYPAEAQLYSNPNVQKAISVCYHLKDESDKFYLSCNSLSSLLGVHQQIISRMLNMFIFDGLIVRTEKGKRNGKASEYVWFGRPSMYKATP